MNGINAFINNKLFTLCLMTGSLGAGAAEPPCTLEIDLVKIIGPASLDRLRRGFSKAKELSCGSLFISINTPGGSLQSTRLIVEEILNAEVPTLCLVAPAGGHAGSAGAIILQACHVSGAIAATNIGAATPISGMGQEIPEDLRKKLLNDTRSWLEGITRHRGRSEQFGRDIILEAKAVDAKEAHRLGAIDWVGPTKDEFLKFAADREVKMKGEKKTKVKVGKLVPQSADLRFQILQLVADPNIAYMMFMGSLALLYFEITHPGMIVPGVLGGIGLILSLVSFHTLDVEWGGVLLILLGIAFLIAEIFVPSFGMLGVGGIVSFMVGSVFLFDVETTGHSLSFGVIIPTALLLAGIMLGLGYLAYSSLKTKRSGGFDDLIGEEAEVVELKTGDQEGFVFVQGENWKFKSETAVSVGDRVKILGHKGLILDVKKKES